MLLCAEHTISLDRVQKPSRTPARMQATNVSDLPAVSAGCGHLPCVAVTTAPGVVTVPVVVCFVANVARRIVDPGIRMVPRPVLGTGQLYPCTSTRRRSPVARMARTASWDARSHACAELTFRTLGIPAGSFIRPYPTTPGVDSNRRLSRPQRLPRRCSGSCRVPSAKRLPCSVPCSRRARREKHSPQRGEPLLGRSLW
jgi:hypothetical protein